VVWPEEQALGTYSVGLFVAQFSLPRHSRGLRSSEEFDPMRKRSALLALILAFAASLLAQGPPSPQGNAQGQGRGQAGGGRRGAAPPRDTAAQQGTGVIAGKIVAADTGRPLRRARVVVTGGGRPHVANTDEQGRYRVTGLPAGAYMVTAAKSGFVDGAFGQRRSVRTGTPVELTDRQQAVNVDVKLARGGVVTGRVLDEEGEPLARAVVTVLRRQYIRGEKQLTPAGGDQTDDRGQYRIFGLSPGDYYVSATAGGLDQIVRQVIGGRGGGIDQAPESTGYAPTYYPGVTTAGDATKVKLAAAQELAGVDFQVQIVPLATVKGIVAGGSAMVSLVPEDGGSLGAAGGALGALGGSIAALAGRGDGGRGTLAGGALRAFTREDGTFSIANVTPGKYTIVARADGGAAGGGPRMAVQSLVVAGEEVDVALTPAPGVQLSGTITLEASGTQLPQGFRAFRVVPFPVGSMPAFAGGRGGGRSGGDPADNGHFTVADVMPGLYMLRATGPRGWTMKSVYVDGRDVTDLPLEVKGDNVSSINVIFTDKISSLAGAVRDARGNGVGNVSVIAFPSDPKLWSPQSRHIMTARTDATGAYRLTAVPPGDYFVAAVEDVEPGEWFDPEFLDQIKDEATKVKVDEGEQKTQDLKGPST
jgi:protocatechuate 3,4-dioxygenase beta subunit